MKKIYLVLRYLATRPEVMRAFAHKEEADSFALSLQLEYDQNSGDHDLGTSYGSYRFAVEPTVIEQ